MSAQASTPRHRFTGAQVERMLEAGILTERERFELLQGDLVLVPPQGPIHAGLLERLDTALRDVYKGYRIRVGMPIIASPESEPEPDLAVTRGPHGLSHPHCSEAVLVIEVSYTSMRDDLNKVLIYAKGSVAEYWLVDVKGRTLEQYTGPLPHGGYQSHQVLGETDQVTLPGTQTVWSVASLLP